MSPAGFQICGLRTTRSEDILFDYIPADMQLAHSDEVLVVLSPSSSQAALMVAKVRDPLFRYLPLNRSSSGMSVSPRHSVVLLQTSGPTQLVELSRGTVLQDLWGIAAAHNHSFTPDGLGIVAIEADEYRRPVVWKFHPSASEDSATSSFSLGLNGPRGRFVSVGVIGCPYSEVCISLSRSMKPAVTKDNVSLVQVRQDIRLV